MDGLIVARVAHVGVEFEIVFGFLLCYGAAGAVGAFVFWLGFPVSLATSLCLVSSDWGCLCRLWVVHLQ